MKTILIAILALTSTAGFAGTSKTITDSEATLHFCPKGVMDCGGVGITVKGKRYRVLTDSTEMKEMLDNISGTFEFHSLTTSPPFTVTGYTKDLTSTGGGWGPPAGTKVKYFVITSGLETLPLPKTMPKRQSKLFDSKNKITIKDAAAMTLIKALNSSGVKTYPQIEVSLTAAKKVRCVTQLLGDCKTVCTLMDAHLGTSAVMIQASNEASEVLANLLSSYQLKHTPAISEISVIEVDSISCVTGYDMQLDQEVKYCNLEQI